MSVTGNYQSILGYRDVNLISGTDVTASVTVSSAGYQQVYAQRSGPSTVC